MEIIHQQTTILTLHALVAIEFQAIKVIPPEITLPMVKVA